jgi:hypothetical protein
LLASKLGQLPGLEGLQAVQETAIVIIYEGWAVLTLWDEVRLIVDADVKLALVGLGLFTPTVPHLNDRVAPVTDVSLGKPFLGW